MVAIPELPADARFVRALLQSEELLQQQANSVFARCDLNKNGQIERDELQLLCEAMHQRIGLKMLDQIELGRRLGRFDVDFSGGLDSEEFVKLYKNLLQDAVGDAEPQLSRRRSRSRPKVTEQSLELPSDPRYIRALLSSEHLLKQQAFGVFVQLDLDGNGQLDRDELFGLCLALHRKLGVKLPDDVAVGLQLAKYDEDLSGGLDRNEFVNLYKQILQDSLGSLALERPTAIKAGDEVLAPYLGEDSSRRYHALVTGITEASGQRFVCLRWLRPPGGQRPKEYVSGHGLDDTECTRVPMELVLPKAGFLSI